MAQQGREYLENLRQFVLDDARTVTYKWLSLELGIEANVAKQMLFEFADAHKSDVAATYYLSGPARSAPEVHRVMVVPADRLDAQKAELAEVTAIHVYSVQRSAPADGAVLYAVDNEQAKKIVQKSGLESGVGDLRYSGIKTPVSILPRAKSRRVVAPEPEPAPAPAPAPKAAPAAAPAAAAPAAAAAAAAPAKPAKPAKKRSSLESFFANPPAHKLKKSPKKEAAPKREEAPKQETRDAALAKMEVSDDDDDGDDEDDEEAQDRKRMAEDPPEGALGGDDSDSDGDEDEDDFALVTRKRKTGRILIDDSPSPAKPKSKTKAKRAPKKAKARVITEDDEDDAGDDAVIKETPEEEMGKKPARKPGKRSLEKALKEQQRDELLEKRKHEFFGSETAVERVESAPATRPLGAPAGRTKTIVKRVKVLETFTNARGYEETREVEKEEVIEVPVEDEPKADPVPADAPPAKKAAVKKKQGGIMGFFKKA